MLFLAIPPTNVEERIQFSGLHFTAIAPQMATKPSSYLAYRQKPLLDRPSNLLRPQSGHVLSMTWEGTARTGGDGEPPC